MPVTLRQIGSDPFPWASGVVPHEAGATRAKIAAKTASPATQVQTATRRPPPLSPLVLTMPSRPVSHQSTPIDETQRRHRQAPGGRAADRGYFRHVDHERVSAFPERGQEATAPRGS